MIKASAESNVGSNKFEPCLRYWVRILYHPNPRKYMYNGYFSILGFPNCRFNCVLSTFFLRIFLFSNFASPCVCKRLTVGAFKWCSNWEEAGIFANEEFFWPMTGQRKKVLAPNWKAFVTSWSQIYQFLLLLVFWFMLLRYSVRSRQ